MRETVVAELAPDPVPNPAWQPMRSAPKRVRILVRLGILGDPDPSRDRVAVATWSQIESCWRDTSIDVVQPIYPTAWAPIPPFYLEQDAAA